MAIRIFLVWTDTRPRTTRINTVDGRPRMSNIRVRFLKVFDSKHFFINIFEFYDLLKYLADQKYQVMGCLIREVIESPRPPF